MRLLAPFIVLVVALGVTVYLDDTPADADLVFVNRSDVFTLDPQRQSYVQDFRMTYALYEGLVRWNNRDFTFEPAAAETWEAADKRYVFHLRKDARWSNGVPVTAHDFVYSWKRLLLPETAADYSNLIFCIEGAEPFWNWRNDQLKAFVANPWKASEDDVVEATGAMVRRMRMLLAADDLPTSVAVPDTDLDTIETQLSTLERPLAELQALQKEIDEEEDEEKKRQKQKQKTKRYLQTVKVFREQLMTDLALEEAWTRLDAPVSRAAETDWMWARTRDRFADTVAIKALDEHTLEVRLARPTAYFLDLVCFGVCSPVYRPCVEGWSPLPAEEQQRLEGEGWHVVEPPDWAERRWVSLNPESGRFEQLHQWARPGSLVSNGPYRLAQWRYKRDIRLERNDAYHTPARARSESVVALTIEDTNTRVLAFESGKLHWLSDVGAEYQADMIAERDSYIARHQEEIDRLRTEDPDRPLDEILATLPPPGPGERRDIHTIPTFGTDFYSFNCREFLSDDRPNPFHDAAVRRAFVMSVDKQAIVEKVTRLGEPVLTTFIPPGSIPGYTSPDGLGYDVEQARIELEKAGWKDEDGDGLVEDREGRPFPVIDLLWTTNTPRYKWMSLELKAQWERELGVRVELRGADTKFYKEDLKQGKFMIARGRWYGDYGDPTTFLDLCREDDGNNDRKFFDEDFEDLMIQAETESDPVKRMDLLHEAERIIAQEQVPMLFVCQLVQVYMYDPTELSGMSPHARLTQYLWQLEVDDE